jgi:hypothetical protein
LEAFPLTHTKGGWKEGDPPGHARVVFRRRKIKGKDNDVFLGVIGHDESMDGLHYAAVHTKKKE